MCRGWCPWYRANLENLARRRQGLKAEEGQESSADPEGTQEELDENEPEIEVVEPPEELDPSAREDFNQAYIKKLQAVDKEVEEYARTLDSVSYPVSFKIPLAPQQTPHACWPLLGLVIFGHHPASRRLRIRTLLDKYVPALC